MKNKYTLITPPPTNAGVSHVKSSIVTPGNASASHPKLSPVPPARTSRQNFRLKPILLLIALLLFSCESFVKIDPPRTALVTSTVFESDATASAAMINVYYQMSLMGFASGGTTSVSFLTAFSSDEELNYNSTSPTMVQFNDNELTSDNEFVTSLWSDMYKALYQVNAIIEGATQSKTLSPSTKSQLEGEAKFMRAFCLFYLVNLYGDVPLITSTDYRANTSIARTPSSKVYQQIIQDLADAENLLPGDYSVSNGEKVRVNNNVAKAFLARVYLYQQDWSKAELYATKLIENTGYALVTDPTQVMVKNNSEAIWQFNNSFYPNDFSAFYLFSTPPNVGSLRIELINSFEENDLRLASWVGSITNGATVYHFPIKYHSFVSAAEYSTVFRLAEQYLIRAEARTHLNNFTDAQSDINVIRNRAGLANTTANDEKALLLAVEQERRVELFTEWGHRWFDLRRTNRSDAILSVIKTKWQSTDALYPIPKTQILGDPSMSNAQNPGY